MNLLQLVFKQMRQRTLSSCLTLLSVVLGVGLATATLIAQRSGGTLFGQSDFGYDVLIGAKGSKLQLVLNTAYHLGQSQGTIPYSVYEKLGREVAWKVPFAVGDNFEGHRIIGTSVRLFGIDEDGQALAPEKRPQYRRERGFALASGQVFHPRKFEAIVGSELAARLPIGAKFKGTHGAVADAADKDEHEEQWTVVGIMKPTHTANDRVIFIPLTSFLAIPEHEKSLVEIGKLAGAATHPAAAHEHEEAYTLGLDGSIELKLPKDEWRISAILARSKGVLGMGLMWTINNGQEAMAVNPASEMREFFENFLTAGTSVLLLISVLVSVVAAVSILVSIYNSVVAQRREIAILRALGATRQRVLALVCLEAGLIGAAGAVGGLVLGHALGAAGSWYMMNLIGEGIPWLAVSRPELVYLGCVVVLAVLAGLVPALKAYSTPVATNLVA